MYSKPIKVVYTFYCSFFFSKPVTRVLFFPSPGLKPATVSRFSHGLFFFSLFYKQCTDGLSFFLQAAACIRKTSKMSTRSHELFRSVCVSVVTWPSFFTSRSLTLEFVAYLCDVSFTKSKLEDCTRRKSQCTKMQGGYGSPFI